MLDILQYIKYIQYGFPGDSVVKNLPANAGDISSSPGQEHPLEKEMATYSSILAWETPWTEEPRVAKGWT